MFLDECFKRYGLSESFVKKISTKKSSDIRNKDFQIDDADDFWDIVLNFVKQKQNVVDINPIVLNQEKWFYDILGYQSNKEVDVTKIYFGDSIQQIRFDKKLHILTFYKFFEYEGELFAFRIQLEKYSDVLSLLIDFSCRTKKGCGETVEGETVETIIYDTKDRCWGESVFDWSRASWDFLEVVLNIINLFADDFESSCIPQLPKNFHRRYWEKWRDKYYVDVQKISIQMPMTTAIQKVLKQKGIV